MRRLSCDQMSYKGFGEGGEYRTSHGGKIFWVVARPGARWDLLFAKSTRECFDAGDRDRGPVKILGKGTALRLVELTPRLYC
jgi:hypothetical protein